MRLKVGWGWRLQVFKMKLVGVRKTETFQTSMAPLPICVTGKELKASAIITNTSQAELWDTTLFACFWQWHGASMFVLSQSQKKWQVRVTEPSSGISNYDRSTGRSRGTMEQKICMGRRLRWMDGSHFKPSNWNIRNHCWFIFATQVRQRSCILNEVLNSTAWPSLKSNQTFTLALTLLVFF